MLITPYLHKAQYYETDQLGIIHHSNYLRWMEEARVDFLEQIGMTYAGLEQMGFSSPLLSAACTYKTPVRFSETVRILCTIADCTGVRMRITYRIEDEKSGVLRTTGETTHCFINIETGRPVNMDKVHPVFMESLRSVQSS